jgi:hypothetical protein
MTANQNDSYAVVWPRGKKSNPPTEPAKRLSTLKGKVIAELWDYAFQGELSYPMIEEEISKRFPGVKFIGPDAFGNTHGGDEHEVIAGLPEKLKEYGVDAVISGIGA